MIKKESTVRSNREPTISFKQADKFLHEIQKPKMKEVWGNKEDEAWENA